MNTILEILIWVPPVTDIGQEKIWISGQLKKLGIKKLTLLAQRATRARTRTYSPYSHYGVGASILTTSGKIFDGVNAERAGFSETDHAEESAITGAIIGGEIRRSGRKFIRVLAVSHSGDTAPCGRCRQIIVEHCDNALIIVADTGGNIRRITSAKTLLPYAFTPSDLGIK